ncbi:condensation domain-containing protein [Amycolatopsis sp. NPDC004079]|uniref:condensation domain-containing protein n=1 Tax=Amycolatopsis sp. NPDC004079 TaxID=3154549 RepID=UPI0033A77ECE
MTDVFPQTFEQEAIWIADQFAGSPSPFLETWAQRISGPLDVPALERALRALVGRNAAFRTRFTLDETGPIQLIDPVGALPFERLPWPGGDLHEVLRRAGQRPLDLTSAPARMTLYDYGPDEYVLLLQIHHVIVDDASLVLIDRELSALYSEQVVDAPAFTLGEHAVRQRAAGIADEDLTFWSSYLNGARAMSHLPPHPRQLPARRGTECACVRGTVPAELSDAVRSAARSLRTTANVLMSVCLAFVAAAVNDDDIVLGTPMSRRGDPDLDDVIGCLTDLLPVRYQVSADATVGEVCAAAKRTSLAVLRHRNVPYALLGGGVTRERGVLSGSHLGRICLVLDEAPSHLELPGLRCERVYVAGAAAKFDWLQYVVADGKSWQVRADYATDYFTADEAHAVLKQWLTALSLVSGDLDLPVRTLLDQLEARR